jgi:hypothetical protein
MRLKALLGLLALTLAAAVLLLALLVGGAAGGHGKGKGHNNGSASHGRMGYHFLVLDQIEGQPDRMIIQGNGSFNRNRASGGGTFDHFLAGTGPPATLVATGTWKAEDVVSWSPGLSHGVLEGGILIIHATFKPIGQPRIKNVLLEVDCNLGPAGFNTGKTEGVVATFPDGTVFTPTPTPQGTPNTGLTVFTLTKGHKH